MPFKLVDKFSFLINASMYLETTKYLKRQNTFKLKTANFCDPFGVGDALKGSKVFPSGIARFFVTGAKASRFPPISRGANLCFKLGHAYGVPRARSPNWVGFWGPP